MDPYNTCHKFGRFHQVTTPLPENNRGPLGLESQYPRMLRPRLSEPSVEARCEVPLSLTRFSLIIVSVIGT